MRFDILTIILCLTLCGCKGKEDNISDPFIGKVNIDVHNSVPMSEVLSSKETIVFSDDVKNIMGFPRDVVVKGDTIYAVSTYPSPGIFAYLKNGKQLFSYCSPGSGPADLNSPSCISVTDTEISTYDDSSFKIIRTDKSGNFIGTLNAPVMTLNALIDEEGNQWFDFTNQEREQTRVSWKTKSDTAIQTVMTVPELQKGITIIGIEALQNLYDGSVGYTPAMEPRIYTLYNGKSVVRYELDFNGLWPDDETFKKDYTGNAWAPKSSHFPVQQLRFHENDRYFILGFKNEKQPYLHILDKQSGKEKTLQLNADDYINSCYVVDSEVYLTRKDDKMEIMTILEL